ncbi:unnamed protein product [Rhizophagus irregularis]|uniref:Uncharacterized protein n=1 Tax=Rhizophagus irregularis TaxID=588596 RepID=A0A915ZAN6_9GLOM|nr:unnamed protein product [Rhizophagus irregularis]
MFYFFDSDESENPYENAFNVKVNKTVAVSELKELSRKKLTIILRQKTSSYGRSTFPSMKKTKNLSSINVNIKEELGASSSSQSATVESDTVEITTERKVIQFSADEDLLRIIWTTNPKVDLEIVVDTSQQPFSSYTFFSLIAMINYHVLRLEVQQLQKRSGTVCNVLHCLNWRRLGNNKSSKWYWRWE